MFYDKRRTEMNRRRGINWNRKLSHLLTFTSFLSCRKARPAGECQISVLLTGMRAVDVPESTTTIYRAVILRASSASLGRKASS